MNGLHYQVTKSENGRDVWLHFKAADGMSCGLSIAALAEKSGPLIGKALRSWASDRLEEHDAEKIAAEERMQEITDNSQFGVGA